MSAELPMVSVVVPAYNEGSHLEQSLEAVVAYMDTLSSQYRWELIVVDDGSTDNTLTVAESLASTNSNVRVAPHPSNFKLGQALRYGFSVSRGDYIVTLDADLSYSPDHIGRLLEAITTTEAKIVIASPYMEGGAVTGVPPMRLAASRWANRLLSAAAKGHLTTVTGMVRAYDAVFLRRLDLKAMDVEINAEIIYKAQIMRARITEIPAHLEWTRTDEQDDRQTFRPGRSISGFAFVSFLFRPYAYFLIPGAAVGAGAVLLWLLAIVLVLRGVPVGGAMLMAVLLTMLSAVLLGMGVLSAQAKRYFEELFHLGTSALTHQRGSESRKGETDSDQRSEL
jgi:glycosyltransferase involved in cell wall biosynthesis